MRVRTIYIVTGAIWGIIGTALIIGIFLLPGVMSPPEPVMWAMGIIAMLLWFFTTLPEPVGTAIAAGVGVAAFVLVFGGCVWAGFSIGRRHERSQPEPIGRRRAIRWLLVSCVVMVLVLACDGVVLHLLRQEFRQEEIQRLAAVAQDQKTQAIRQELLATFHSVEALKASLRADACGLDVSARFSGQRGGAYRLEFRVLSWGDATLSQSIETIQLGAGESRIERFIEYREIIAGYRKIKKYQNVHSSTSLKLIARIHPLLTPTEQSVLGLADLGSTQPFTDPPAPQYRGEPPFLDSFQYSAWFKRASATAEFDVDFNISGSNYEIVHPGRTPGRCTGGG